MAKPNPDPPSRAFVVKNGSSARSASALEIPTPGVFDEEEHVAASRHRLHLDASGHRAASIAGVQEQIHERLLQQLLVA